MVESKYSKYSKYYDMRERDATCNTCGKVLKMNNNDTKGLKYHAEKKHSIIFEVKLENDSGFDNQTKKPFKCTELNSLGIECEKRYSTPSVCAVAMANQKSRKSKFALYKS